MIYSDSLFETRKENVLFFPNLRPEVKSRRQRSRPRRVLSTLSAFFFIFQNRNGTFYFGTKFPGLIHRNYKFLKTEMSVYGYEPRDGLPSQGNQITFSSLNGAKKGGKFSLCLKSIYRNFFMYRNHPTSLTD